MLTQHLKSLILVNRLMCCVSTNYICLVIKIALHILDIVVRNDTQSFAYFKTLIYLCTIINNMYNY